MATIDGFVEAAQSGRFAGIDPLTNWRVSFTGRDRSNDITAAQAELGYVPGVTFERGLAQMAA